MEKDILLWLVGYCIDQVRSCCNMLFEYKVNIISCLKIV